MGQVIDWIIVKWKGFSLPLPNNNLFKQAVVYIFSGQKPDNLYPKAAFLYKIDHARGDLLRPFNLAFDLYNLVFNGEFDNYSAAGGEEVGCLDKKPFP